MKRALMILFIGMMSCEVLDDAPMVNPDNEVLVIESLLTNENLRHEVRLTTSFQDLNGSPESINNAIVILSDGEENIRLRRDFSRPGVYRLPFPTRAVINKVYFLYVNWEGNEYLAAANAEFVTPMGPPLIIENNGRFEYVYEDTPEPSMTEISVTWNDENGNQEFHTYYYTLNVIDVNSIIPPEKEQLSFPEGAILVRKKYSLSQAHQDFARSYLSEIDWRGGLFDVTPGNVITNFSGGALGFFGVSMVDIDSTIIN